MMEIKKFVELMTGEFDNKEQFMEMKEAGKSFPYAQHINTVCNDKIKNIPEDFNGIFVVEESYYETDGKRHASPHLFLITDSNAGVILSSYEIPGMELPTGLTTATVSQDQNIKVYGGKNQIFVEAQENSEVQILNIYGQIVKSMTVTAGKQVVSVPKGIYIVNNNKVLVY